ncbi:MAG: tRNA-dihydrouridine synthase [Alphaproteobacteria bacterium]
MQKVNRIILAPMEGVMDAQMRHIITQFGYISHCVTEFVRVVDRLLPEHIFYKYCPELKQDTQVNNVPVRVQLLGQNPEYMALNAERAIELGSYGIDINFGCPAKKVNNSKGGAVLLKEPETVYRIVKAVREAVGSKDIVSVKMRLGYENTDLAFENAHAIEEAGASELAVHGRTKIQAYTGESDWTMIGQIKQKLEIPVIANGDINSFSAAQKCMSISGCWDIMIGRASLAIPNIAAVINGKSQLKWSQILNLLYLYGDGFELQDKSQYYHRRIKQWLRYLMTEYDEAVKLFEQIKTLQNKDEIKKLIYKKYKEYQHANTTY